MPGSEEILMISIFLFFLGIPILFLIFFIVLFRKVGRIEKELAVLKQKSPEVSSQPELKPIVAPQPEQDQIQPPPPIKKEAPDWEAMLVKVALPWIGMAAILLATGFFLKYAFEHRWFTDAAKVMTGFLSGIGFMLTGEYFYKKQRYPGFRAVVSGGGIAVVYLSSFAAFSLYHLVPRTIALALLILTTVTCGIISSHRKAAGIAILGLTGGFLTPIMLSTGTDPGLTLLVYILILDVGAVWFSRRHAWRFLELLSLSGSIALATGWYLEFGSRHGIPSDWAAMMYPMSIFLLFTTAAALRHSRREIKPVLTEILSTILAPTYAFIAGWAALEESSMHAGGYFALVFAVIYLLLAMIHKARNPDYPAMMVVFGTLAFAFVSLAIPIQLKGWTVPLLWVIEGAAFSYIGFIVSKKLFHVAGNFLVWVGSTSFLIQSAEEQLYNAVPFINRRFLTFAVITIVLYASAYLIKSGRSQLKSTGLTRMSWIILASILTVWTVSLEIFESCRYQMITMIPEGLANILVTLFWTVYSISLMAAGIAYCKTSLRITSALLFFMAVIKLFLYDLSTIGIVYRIIGGMAFGIIALTASYLYYRIKADRKSPAVDG